MLELEPREYITSFVFRQGDHLDHLMLKTNCGHLISAGNTNRPEHFKKVEEKGKILVTLDGTISHVSKFAREVVKSVTAQWDVPNDASPGKVLLVQYVCAHVTSVVIVESTRYQKTEQYK